MSLSISAEALICWRLSSHGWAGQDLRTATTHRPRAGSGMQGRNAACKMLFMPSALHFLISRPTEYFKMCPGLFSTTLLSCGFVWSLGKGRQGFSDFSFQEKNCFTLTLAFIYQRQSLRPLQKRHLNFYLQAHLPAINQKHSHSAGCQTHLDGYMEGLCEGFCFSFLPASLGRHIKTENSVTLEAFNQLKILPEVNGHNSDKQSPSCWILFI